MTPKQLLAALPSALLVLCSSSANAGKTVEEAGALVCVTDKWDEKELEKGHKQADAAMRCVAVPDDPTLDKYAQDCVGKYEYMPDGSWKSAGSCTNSYKSGDKSYETWAEALTSRNTRMRKPVAPANMRASLAAARTVRGPDGQAFWRQIQGDRLVLL